MAGGAIAKKPSAAFGAARRRLCQGVNGPRQNYRTQEHGKNSQFILPPSPIFHRSGLKITTGPVIGTVFPYDMQGMVNGELMTVLAVLGIAALTKYLFSRQKSRAGAGSHEFFMLRTGP